MIDGPLDLPYLTGEQQSSILGLNPRGYCRSQFYAQF